MHFDAGNAFLNGAERLLEHARHPGREFLLAIDVVIRVHLNLRDCEKCTPLRAGVMSFPEQVGTLKRIALPYHGRMRASADAASLCESVDSLRLAADD